MKETIKAIHESEAMKKAFAFFEQDDAHTLDQLLELVQISAFSNDEKERALHFQKMIEAEGYKTHMDDVWNVYTTIPGTGDGPTVYISAHIDTVFPPDTPLEIKRDGNKIAVPGIGDDTRGLAEILSMLRAIREAGLRPKGDIIIGGNVGEEGLGNLRGMRHFFKENADKVDGFLSLDGVACLICYGGTGSYRYKVTFKGPGGHSNGAFGLVNPIHAMGRAISYISEMRTPPDPKTTFCVGVIEGGTSVNSIAYECSMLMDMRSNGKAELDVLDGQFKACVQKAVEDENNRWVEERTWAASGFGGFDTEARITVDLELLGDRPVGNQPEDCEIVRVIGSAYSAYGVTPALMSHGSTDANIAISMGIPGVCIAGGGKTGGTHSVDEWYDPTDGYKGPQRNLLALFALTGLDGVSEPLLSKRDK